MSHCSLSAGFGHREQWDRNVNSKLCYTDSLKDYFSTAFHACMTVSGDWQRSVK